MNRNNYIDYAKAICIIFVVYIHIGFSNLNNIVLFAMPTFFVATGYTFSLGKRSFRENAVSRFKSIMVPYYLLMIFYTFIEIIRAHLFGYGDASIAYSSLANTIYGSGIFPWNGVLDSVKTVVSYKAQPQVGVDLILPSNCHLWFLPAMFTGYLMFVPLVKVVRRNPLLKVVVLLCLLLFASLEVLFPQACQLPFGIGRGALGASFMLCGFWLKDYKLMEHKSKGYYIFTNLAALVLFVGALYFGSDGSALVRSYYGQYGIFSVLFTFIGGLAGTWLMLSLCKLLEKIPVERVKKTLSYMGRNVMIVYAWHMVVKFVFDAVYICLIKHSDSVMLDQYKMGLMPQDSMWFMLFEGASVIVICLLCNKAFQKRKNICR